MSSARTDRSPIYYGSDTEDSDTSGSDTSDSGTDDEGGAGTRRPKSGDEVLGKYKLLEKLGAGGFGRVFRAKSNKNNSKTVAIKIERNKVDSLWPSVTQQYEWLSALYRKPGIPITYDHGIVGNYGILVTELLGPSLHHIVEKIDSKRFSPQAVSFIGRRILKTLQICHRNLLIHSDVKPDNIVTTIDNTENRKHRLYLIDFGSAHPFSSYKQERKMFTKRRGGSYMYISNDQLLGHLGTAVDDCLSLAYSLLHLLTGDLPWMEAPDFVSMMTMKSQITIMEDVPNEILQFVYEVEGTRLNDFPDYERLENILAGLCDEEPDFEGDDYIEGRREAIAAMKKLREK